MPNSSYMAKIKSLVDTLFGSQSRPAVVAPEVKPKPRVKIKAKTKNGQWHKNRTKKT